MKVEIRHYQRTEDDGTPFYYNGNDSRNIFKTATPPLGFTNVYQDVSSDVENLNDLLFSYSRNNTDQHNSIENVELTVNGPTKAFITDWLYSRPYASQNIIEVKFTDTKCGRVISEFIIKAQKLRFCTDDPCRLSVVAEANNRQYECFAKYTITDDWNGFQSQEYRAYDYVVEKRPKIMTKILYMFGSILFLIALPLVDIMIILNASLAAINAVLVAFGFDPLPPIPQITPDAIVEVMRRMLGFGRTHSAASVADYTRNVADRCGVPVDEDNNLFFQDNLTLPDGTTRPNPYKNLDIMFAESQEGRRNDNTDKRLLIPNNLSLLTLPKLYNHLALWANATWYISPVHGLRFYPKYTSADGILYDYSQQQRCEEVNGAKWEKICIENAQDNPALGRTFEFTQDSQDQAGNDALVRYKSRAVLDSNEDNPNLKGLDDVTVNFGAARFRDDGINKEFVRDAINDPMTFFGTTMMFIFFLLIILNAIGNITGTGIALGTIVLLIGLLILAAIALYISGAVFGLQRYPSVLQTSSGTFEKPKLLLWDGVDAEEANVVTQANFPDPNTNHNSDIYPIVHPYNEDPIRLHNYPVFLDCRFEGTAFSLLHSHADKRNVSLVENKIEIDLFACCEHRSVLGLYQGEETGIYKRIKVATVFDVSGNPIDAREARTQKIDVNYDTGKVKIYAVGR